MKETSTETRSIIVERVIAHPPEKIWRALTQPHLIEEWLMKNSFAPVVGHRFDVEAQWGTVHCQVQAIEPNRVLSYSWDTKDLKSIITWTLTPTASGTLLRMEQSGFRHDQESYFRGATGGWPRFLAALEQVLERMD